MAKSKIDKEREKLIKLYDLENKSHRDIDKIAKGNVELGLTLHKIKNDMGAKKISVSTIKKEAADKTKESKKQAKEAVKKSKEAGHTMSVKVKVQPAKKATGSTQKTEPGAKKKSTGKKKSSGSTQKKSAADRKKQTEKLRSYREQLQILVDEANSRVDRLSGMKRTTSRALDEARRTLPASREPNGALFTANLRTENQITRELARVMAFLGDYTSLAKGAENFTEDLSSAGLFGGQYRANGGPGYSDEVDPEVGEKVFDIYHRVLEVEGGWPRVMAYFKANSGGLVEYGSENLINAIYDMVSNFGTSDKATEKIINRATTMIEDMISMYQDMAMKQRSGVDYGFLGNDENAQDRRNRWEFDMKRRGLK